MMMEQQKKSIGWHILHSLWLIILFIPFGLLAPFAFFYIGYRAGQRKWIRTGAFYLILIYGSFILIGEFNNEIISDIAVFTNLFVWLYILIHGIAIRPQFIRLLIIQEEKRKLNYMMEHRGESAQMGNEGQEVKSIGSYSDGTIDFGNEPNKMEPSSNKRSNEPKEIKIININKANEEEIALLPYIPRFLAKKIIKKREEEGPFTSIKHLAAATNIKPHILMRSKPYIVFQDEDLIALDDKEVVNKKSNSKGRIVDF